MNVAIPSNASEIFRKERPSNNNNNNKDSQANDKSSSSSSSRLLGIAPTESGETWLCSEVDSSSSSSPSYFDYDGEEEDNNGDEGCFGCFPTTGSATNQDNLMMIVSNSSFSAQQEQEQQEQQQQQDDDIETFSILNNSNDNNQNQKITSTECPICFTTTSPSNTLTLQNCKHTFCLPCLETYIQIQIEQGNANNILCPHPPKTCGRPIPPPQLYQILKHDKQKCDRLNHFALEAAIAQDGSFIHCPTPDCPYVGFTECSSSSSGEDFKVLECLVCEKSSCVKCQVSPFHDGLSCQEYQELSSLQEQEQEQGQARKKVKMRGKKTRRHLKILRLLFRRKKKNMLTSASASHEAKKSSESSSSAKEEIEWATKTISSLPLPSSTSASKHTEEKKQKPSSSSSSSSKEEKSSKNNNNRRYSFPTIQQQQQQNEEIIKPCPKCKAQILKESGCDKMKCRCGYRFCFICGIENATCGHTAPIHGYIDNVTGRPEFTYSREKYGNRNKKKKGSWLDVLLRPQSTL